MRKFLSLIAVSLLLSSAVQAKVKVVATTADVGSIVKAVGARDIELTVIAKGTQDPHFIEAKPSYMVRLRDADLLVSNGLSLEVGWLPTLVRGARNPKLNSSSQGHLDLGSLIEPIEKPTGGITRADGDVHPEGNPHFTLDPVRVGELALKVAARLGEIDAANKDAYLARAKAYQERLNGKTKEWQKRIEQSGTKKVITYHPSLNYFLSRFGLSAPRHLEAKPGVPPSARHILQVVALMKSDGIKLILVDSFFDTQIADRVAKEVPGSKVASVGIAVESEPELKSTEDVIEALVKTIESK